MSNSEKSKFYLKEVQLSGYKSIKDVDIDFEPGLNIIIGKNAAGKTNFLKFLNKVMNFDYLELNNFKSSFIIENENKISINASQEISAEEFIKKSSLASNVEIGLSINNLIIINKTTDTFSIIEELISKSVNYNSILLSHGLPRTYPVVNSPFSFTVEKNLASDNITKLIAYKDTPFFVKSLVIDIMLITFDFKRFDLYEVKKSLSDFFDLELPINDYLKKYSPVQKIRFTKNVNFFIDDEKEVLNVSNLYLEFEVDGVWLPFNSLSDGTQRLFYIISEVYENGHIFSTRPTSYGTLIDSHLINRIILIEEPELGIHPHQYHQLLEFLKIQSENSQIIISTHSPQSLDILEEEEFNRIIIAYTENAKEGTKMRHLNEGEFSKAKQYKKENYLSDYWLYSDLEK